MLRNEKGKIKMDLAEMLASAKEEGIKEGREIAIDECKQILKTQHMLRTCEDDYIAGIEVPFYRKLWKKFDELKEK